MARHQVPQEHLAQEHLRHQGHSTKGTAWVQDMPVMEMGQEMEPEMGRWQPDGDRGPESSLNFLEEDSGEMGDGQMPCIGMSQLPSYRCHA